jgi:hypothetical protein
MYIKKFSILPILFLIVLVVLLYFQNKGREDNYKEPVVVNNFIDCVREGNMVMESYPRQCRSLDGRLFVEDIGNVLEKNDLIRVFSPLPNEKIVSPLEIEGEARGYWFFEGDFHVVLTDSGGNIISDNIAVAKDDWMTESFVDFSLVLSFDNIESDDVGRLIFKKDNPKGLKEYDDHLDIPVIFE